MAKLLGWCPRKVRQKMASSQETVSWLDMPKKGQLCILFLLRFAEPCVRSSASVSERPRLGIHLAIQMFVTNTGLMMNLSRRTSTFS